jgi:LPXTG-site transpeptidase (sortase) family protein
MRNFLKIIISWGLTLALILTLFPVSVFAQIATPTNNTSVTGKVVGPDNRAVSGAIIQITATNRLAGLQPPFLTQSGTDGNFAAFGFLPQTNPPLYTALVRANKAGYLEASNTYTITAGLFNQNLPNFLVLKTTDLKVTTTNNVGYAIPGQEVNYSISITNTGNVTATSITIDDNWSPVMTYVSDTSSSVGLQLISSNGSNRSWSKDKLGPDKSFAFSLKLIINGNPPLNISNIFNDVNVSNRQVEADISNNNDTDSDNFTILSGYTYDGSTGLPLAGIKVRLSGENMTQVYTQTTDTVGFYRFISTRSTPIASGRSRLEANDSPTYRYTLDVFTPNLSFGQIINHNFQLFPGSSLIAAMSTSPKDILPLVPGRDITYIFTISNRGLQDASSLVIRSSLSAGLQFKSTSGGLGGQPSFDPTAGTLSWNLSTLKAAPPNVITQTLVATVLDPIALSLPETITHTLKVTSAPIDTYLADNTVSLYHSFTSLKGLVRDSNGNPIKDGEIIFVDSNKVSHVEKTLASGWYEFISSAASPLALGQGTVSFVKSGFVSPAAIPVTIIANKFVRQDVVIGGAPFFNLVKTVTPAEAKAGGTFNFSIVATNIGGLVATNVTIVDDLPSGLDYSSLQISNNPSSIGGTVIREDRRIKATIASFPINGTVTISLVGVVPTTAKSARTLKNSATLTFGTTSFSSNQVTFRITGTSLPPTGGMEPDRTPPLQGAGDDRFPALAWVAAVLIGALGLLALFYAIRSRGVRPQWSGWFGRAGLILLGAAVLFGLGAAAWNSLSATLPAALNPEAGQPVSTGQKPAQHIEPGPGGEALAIIPPAPVPTATSGTIPEEHVAFQMTVPAEPEKLPDFALPTPPPAASAPPNGGPPDNSPAGRIVIPNLGLDTVIKYVPFNGETWPIAGLKQEVAWMGDTSWPGLGGNTSLAGHITLVNGQDGPFRNLYTLKAGDSVYVYTENKVYTYRVRASQTVADNDMSVIAPTSKPQITLITCWEWDVKAKVYTKRMVVTADLEDSQPVSEFSLPHSN